MDYKQKYIKYKSKYLQLAERPLIILFNGFGSSKLYWEYNFVGTAKLQKNDFLTKLKQIGDVYMFNSNFFNINYYSVPEDNKERIMWRKIYKKYKPHTSDIDFNLEDLDYETICRQVHDQITAKYGTTKRIIVIGHSYGAAIGILFSRLYKHRCILCVAIDNPPYLLEFFKKHDEKKLKKLIDHHFGDNNKLHQILESIKNTPSNEQIDLVYKLISYRSSQDRIKYYNHKLSVPTLFFRAFSTKPDNKHMKQWNEFSVKEKQNLEQHNDSHMLKYFVMLDAEHFVWKKQEYSDMIIDEIKCMMKK